MRLIASVLALSTLAGCAAMPKLPFAGARSAVSSDPLPYDARLVGGDAGPEFAIAVSANGAGLEAVRESVRFGGTRFCLARFGNSEIAWDAAEGSPENWIATVFDDGTAVYTGRCLGR